MTSEVPEKVERAVDERALAEIRRLIQDTKEGNLKSRVEVEGFSGEWREVMLGLNTILDEALGPVNAQVIALEAMARGDLSQRITQEFKGDHGRAKEALNQVADIAGKAMHEMRRMIEASSNGDLKARADVQAFIGDWRELMAGVNTILDEALEPVNIQVGALEAMAEGKLSQKISQEFKGEHNRGKNALNAVGDIAGKAQEEIRRMIEASSNGDLKARAEVQQFVGDWREIMAGVNTILDEALEPVNIQTEILERMAAGDLSARITADFKGDHNRIKGLINEFQDFNQQVVEDIVQISQRLAEGDLRVAPEAQYKGDFAQIRNALETALSGLNTTIRQTNAVVQQVAQSVEQVRAVGQDLAANAEEQSSAVEEVTSNLEETDSQVKANAENANVTNQLVSETTTTANVGQEKMKAVTEAMKAIAQSSQEISKIIKVIDEIAFQTNLLALNAAVEAARAGQHGRGFAVVAQEVRNLAGRSAKAAKETAELIEGSSRRVQEGVAIVDETAEALAGIVQNVVKVKDLVAEISVASEEQARAVTQINAAMLQVNQGSQAGSQQSEELASTADELGSLADRLREEMGRFKLREQHVFGDALGGLGLSGVSPEVMQQLVELVKQQLAAGGPAAATPTKAKPQPGVNGRKEKNGKLELILDRDERGYGQF
ncbi:MAG: hypothetical protein KJ077_03480 [Anaerolineae bacterium]|nr:hypothetical protein [Anaerolineae bacterium]